jgi:AcrR family transcriptional regulator
MRTLTERRRARYLHAARDIIRHTGSIDFSVEDLADQSRQPVASFCHCFSDRDELLFALFQQCVNDATDQIRTAIAPHTDPLVRLEVAVQTLCELSLRGTATLGPLFMEYSWNLRVAQPARLRAVFAPQLDVFVELIAAVQAAGWLRGTVTPRRAGALVMEVAMSIVAPTLHDDAAGPITADEVWEFCAAGLLDRTRAGRSQS